jgi:hypothetical protein
MTTRKVNLSDLQGSLSKKGKPRYENSKLLQAFKEMLEDARQEGADSINMKIGAWIKERQYGKFFSIKVNNYKKTSAPVQNKLPVDDEDIPF